MAGSSEELDLFASTLGCRIGTMPFTYLGLPLGAPFKATLIWLPFIEKIENRLSTWRRNSLSKGGRLVLIRSCLLSLPIYFLSLFPIPTTLAQRMEQLIRRFLWGASASKRPFCLVSWDQCRRPKSHGGLGIRGFTLMNRALLSKWVWRFSKETTALWRRVIKSKYGIARGGAFPKPPRGSHGMGVWKQIAKQVEFVHDHSSFMIGNGHTARFWIDKWCSNIALRFLAPNLFRIVKRKQSLVAEVVQLEAGRISIGLQFYLAVEYEFLEEIVLVHNLVNAAKLDPSRDDILLWGEEEVKEDEHGFSVSSAYAKLIQLELLDLELYPWQQVWRQGVPLKVQFFVWCATLNRTATFDYLQFRRVPCVNECSFCSVVVESALHLLIHCKFANEVWTAFFRSFGCCWFMPETILDLLTQWDYNIFSKRGKKVWSMAAHAILWCLWEERNARCFRGEKSSTMKVVLAARGLLGYWCSAFGNFRDLQDNSFLFLFDRVISS